MSFDSVELARALLFQHAIPVNKMLTEQYAEVQEHLSALGLHLGYVGQHYVTFSFSQALYQSLGARYIKFLYNIIESAQEQPPVFNEDVFDSALLRLLAELKYVEFQQIPASADSVPANTRKSLHYNQRHVAFTSRIFQEMGYGPVCDACKQLGGFMLACGCGKTFHASCCKRMGSCCKQSRWDDVLDAWEFSADNQDSADQDRRPRRGAYRTQGDSEGDDI